MKANSFFLRVSQRFGGRISPQALRAQSAPLPLIAPGDETPELRPKSQYELAVHYFSLEKAGNQPGENEDAWRRGSSEQADQLRLALADGASDSTFARLWANLLVEHAAAQAWSRETLPTAVAAVCDQWAATVQSMDLPWHAEIKVQQGDAATLLCLYLQLPAEADNASWQALSVGDCCLFHYRADELLTAFPISDVASFSNRPSLINSLPARNADLPEKVQIKNGEWRAGDEFILMTDALAAWYLRELTRPQAPLLRLRAIADAKSFRQFVTEQRAHGGLRNDDTTLIRLQIEHNRQRPDSDRSEQKHEQIPDRPSV